MREQNRTIRSSLFQRKQKYLSCFVRYHLSFCSFMRYEEVFVLDVGLFLIDNNPDIQQIRQIFGTWFPNEAEDIISEKPLPSLNIKDDNIVLFVSSPGEICVFEGFRKSILELLNSIRYANPSNEFYFQCLEDLNCNACLDRHDVNRESFLVGFVDNDLRESCPEAYRALIGRCGTATKMRCTSVLLMAMIKSILGTHLTHKMPRDFMCDVMQNPSFKERKNFFMKKLMLHMENKALRGAKKFVVDVLHNHVVFANTNTALFPPAAS